MALSPAKSNANSAGSSGEQRLFEEVLAQASQDAFPAASPDGEPMPPEPTDDESLRPEPTDGDSFDEQLDEPLDEAAPPRPARPAKASGRPDSGPHRERPKWLLDEAGLAGLLEGLNEPQREAVRHPDGPLLVVAEQARARRGCSLGGSLISSGLDGCRRGRCSRSPSRTRPRTRCATACANFWARSRTACGSPPSTRRACGSSARKRTGSATGRASPIYDDADSRRLIEQVERDLDIDTRRLSPRSVQGAISAAKSELMDFETYKSNAETFLERRVGDIYAEYQQRLHAASAMDFDDLLMVTVNLFDSFEDVLAAYRSRFVHVLVDEFQDTNRAQNELVLRLAAEHRNITVVGDVDQSIYRWRGADIRNLLEFEEAFPDAAVVALEQNYRSTKTILDVANAVIVNNVSRVPKDLWTDVGDGDPVCRYRAEDERDEALWVASEIGRLHKAEGLQYGDVAVFYRTNAQSRVLEEDLVRAGIPYKVIGGTRFYDRREVRDVLAYLKVLLNPTDEVSCRRIVNVPKRGVGDTSVERMANWARARRQLVR